MDLFKIGLVAFIIVALVPNYNFAQVIEEKNTGIFIEGNSSVIIETQENETNIFTDNIVTKFGGTFIKRIVNTKHFNDNSPNNSDVNILFPNKLTVNDAYPNPFNPSTSIDYSIPNKSEVQITIYNLLGNIVNTYTLGIQSPGWYEFTWNGINSLNQKISSGIYIVGIKANEQYSKQKITFIE